MTGRSTRNTRAVAVAVALAMLSAIPAAAHAAVDIEPPNLGCVPPPPPPPPIQTTWYATNVGVRCHASDDGSGLADPTQETISVTTAVPSGAEVADAPTNVVVVCDLAENCVTVGPFSFDIDRKAPVVALTTPPNGARYSVLGTLLRPVKVSYACIDGGSGVLECGGTSPNGATLNTGLGALGTHNFRVTATDKVGHTTTVTHTYRVGLL